MLRAAVRHVVERLAGGDAGGRGGSVGPFVPRLIAGLGPLRTFLLSSALAVIAACLFPIFSDLLSWFLIRFAMGVGMGIQWVVSEMWVNRLATGPRRGMILSLYVIVLSAAIALGPFFLSMMGTRGHLPFLATAALLISTCLPLLFATGTVGTETSKARALPLLEAFARKPSAMLTGLIDGFVFQTLLVFIPLYFLRLGSQETTALNFLSIFCLGSVILQLVVGYMLDRSGPAMVLIVCCSIVIAGLALMAEVWEMPAVIWPLLIVMGGAAGAIYTAGLAAIDDASAQKTCRAARRHSRYSRCWRPQWTRDRRLCHGYLESLRHGSGGRRSLHRASRSQRDHGLRR